MENSILAYSRQSLRIAVKKSLLDEDAKDKTVEIGKASTRSQGKALQTHEKTNQQKKNSIKRKAAGQGNKGKTKAAKVVKPEVDQTNQGGNKLEAKDSLETIKRKPAGQGNKGKTKAAKLVKPEVDRKNQGINKVKTKNSLETQPQSSDAKSSAVTEFTAQPQKGCTMRIKQQTKQIKKTKCISEVQIPVSELEQDATEITAAQPMQLDEPKTLAVASETAKDVSQSSQVADEHSQPFEARQKCELNKKINYPKTGELMKKKTKGLGRTLTKYGSIKFNITKPFSLKISSFSIGGIDGLISKGGLEYFSREASDIFCVQDLQTCQKKYLAELELGGYEVHWNLKEKTSGIGILTKVSPISINFETSYEELNRINSVMVMEFEQFILLNVFAPHAGPGLIDLKQKINWHTKFNEFVQEQKDETKPLIIAGNFRASLLEIGKNC